MVLVSATDVSWLVVSEEHVWLLQLLLPGVLEFNHETKPGLRPKTETDTV